MPNSPEQPRQGGREANFSVARTYNSQPSSRPTHSGDTSTLNPDGLGFDEWLDRRKKLVGLQVEEVQLHLQKMSLWERGVKLLLVALLTLTVIGLAIAMFIVSPWLVSLGLPLTAGAAWKRFGKKEGRNIPSDDEGDP